MWLMFFIHLQYNTILDQTRPIPLFPVVPDRCFWEARHDRNSSSLLYLLYRDILPLYMDVTVSCFCS